MKGRHLDPRILFITMSFTSFFHERTRSHYVHVVERVHLFENAAPLKRPEDLLFKIDVILLSFQCSPYPSTTPMQQKSSSSSIGSRKFLSNTSKSLKKKV
jgi:hypothetical protein